MGKVQEREISSGERERERERERGKCFGKWSSECSF